MQALWSVILAGGRGTRLWPWSRLARPKPCLPTPDGPSMIEATLRRVPTPPERTLVITGEPMGEAVREVLPDLPAGNILVEPSARGTGPAIAWAAEEVARRGGDALAVFPCDHLVEPVEVFQASVARAVERVQAGDGLVLLGIDPTHPASAYGYIRADEATGKVRGFVEKPPAAIAEQLLQEGNCWWNAGITVSSVRFLREQVRRHLPGTWRMMQGLQQGRPVASLWYEAEPLAFDHGILERADHLEMVPCAARWSDVGTWESMGQWLQPGPLGRQRVVEGRALEGGDHIVHAPGHRVLTVGLSDLLVVCSDDVLLVARREDASKVPELLGQLGEEWE